MPLPLARPPGSTPLIPVLADPVKEGPFEPDVLARFLRLEPFVLKDLLPFGEEFLIQAGSLKNGAILATGSLVVLSGAHGRITVDSLRYSQNNATSLLSESRILGHWPDSAYYAILQVAEDLLSNLTVNQGRLT